MADVDLWGASGCGLWNGCESDEIHLCDVEVPWNLRAGLFWEQCPDDSEDSRGLCYGKWIKSIIKDVGIFIPLEDWIGGQDVGKTYVFF